MKEMFRFNSFCFIAIAIAVFGCSPKIVTHSSVQKPQLKFLDVYVIPHNYKFENTIVGGLSGIDYDKKSGEYFIISDERSATSPARFYTAKINIKNNKIADVQFTSVNTLKRPDGSVFPPMKEDPVRAADPESIRYNPLKNNLVWSSEGDKAVRNGVAVIQDPSVYEMDLKGNFSDSFHIPLNMRMKAGQAGPRTNGVFEGLSFDKNFKNLYVSTEEPLFEDGRRADFDYAGAKIRITKYDAETKMPIAQYAYLLDAVARKPLIADAFRVNGVPEILWYGDNKLLVMERSFSTGILSCTIKIYMADLTGASNILNVPGLTDSTTYKPASKSLLFNLDSLGRFVDNLEGITFGPILPNGNRSLILIADNNFQILEKSQVFLFEMLD